MRFTYLIVALALGAACAAEPPAAVDPITPQTFDRVRALVKPLPNQQHWHQVKWQLTLWEAQALAAKEGKPIAVMATGGEPLGIC